MHALRTVTVSLRRQAVLIFALTALWWVSLFRDFWSTGSLFWCAVWVYCPFVMLAIRSYTFGILSASWTTTQMVVSFGDAVSDVAVAFLYSGFC
jgi:hypothetical protein